MMMSENVEIIIAKVEVTVSKKKKVKIIISDEV